MDTIVVSSSLRLSVMDATKLWHMCFGYLRERRMMNLSKRYLPDTMKIQKNWTYAKIIFLTSSVG